MKIRQISSNFAIIILRGHPPKVFLSPPQILWGAHAYLQNTAGGEILSLSIEYNPLACILTQSFIINP